VHSSRRIERVTFPDGTTLIRETVISSRHGDAAELSAPLGRAVGAEVPQVFRASPNVLYHQHMPGVTGAQRHPGFTDPYELGYVDSPGGTRARPARHADRDSGS